MVKERIWTKNFICLTVTNSLANVASHMIMPVVPLLILSLGGTETHVGLLTTAFVISSIFIRMFLGILIRKLGRMVVGYAGVILTAIAIGLFCIAGSVGMTAVLRVAQGFGFGVTTTLFIAIVADILPDSRRGEGIGFFTMGVVIAMSIGPAISVIVMEKYGFNYAFLLSAVFPMIAALCLLFYKPPGRASADAADASGAVGAPAQEVGEHYPDEYEAEIKKPPKKESDLRILIKPTSLFLAVLLIINGMCRTADMNYISIFAKVRELDYLAWYFTVQTIASITVRFFVGRIADRKGRSWVIIPGGISIIMAMVLLSVAQAGEVMLLAGFLNGIGIGVLVPSMQLWMFDTFGPSRRDLASAMYFNFYDVGVSVGAILLGLLAEHVGYTFMWQATAIAAVLFLVLYLCFGRERRTAKLP